MFTTTTAQLAGLLAAQVVLQVSAFLYILLFIRRIKKLQEKYKGIDEETKNRFKTYRMAIEKLTKGEKLPQKEWKIIHENEDAYKAYWEEKKLKRKAAIKGYTVCLCGSAPVLIPFIITGTVSFNDFHPAMLTLIIPCAIYLLAVPLWIASIAVIKQTERREVVAGF